MPRRTTNQTRSRRRRPARNNRPSEGLGRASSTIVTNIYEVPSGVSGVTFTVRDLLKRYFDDPRMIKISHLRVKMSLLDHNQSFYQVQPLVTLDEPGAPLVALSSIKQGALRPITMICHIDQPRRFWVLDKNDAFKFLDLRFQSFSGTKLFVEVQTFFNIEVDGITPLMVEQAVSISEPPNIYKDWTILSEATSASIVRKVGPSGNHAR